LSRVIDESVRRVERIPYQDEERVVEITKRMEDKSVLASNNTSDRHMPYRRSEIIESRLTNETGRNLPNDIRLPIRDNNRDFDSRSMRNPLPRLPPPRLPPPRLPQRRLPLPAQVAGDYDPKFQDY